MADTKLETMMKKKAALNEDVRLGMLMDNAFFQVCLFPFIECFVVFICEETSKT